MPQRKSIALFRKNLLALQNSDKEHEFWLYSHSEFDPKGNLTEQSVYAQDGTLVERTVKEYDANGFVVREKYFSEEGGPAEEKKFERNEQGLLIMEFKHYTDGSYDTSSYDYDNQHRILSKVTVNDDGEEEQKLVNEYKGDFLIKTQIFDGDGNLLQSDEFKYDEKGNSVEHRHIDNESGVDSFVVTRYNNNGRKKEETSYDDKGEILSQTFYEEDEHGNLLTITEESEEKNVAIRFVYDEHGNAISQEEIDGEGRQLVVVKRVYNDDNNMISSEVFVDGRGMTLPQHYEIRFDYTFYED